MSNSLADNDDTGILVEFIHTETGFSVVFDDNGKVAYGYLIQADETIVADVWLYNRGGTPTDPEWNDIAKMPFRNALAFVTEQEVTPVENEGEIGVEWLHNESGQLIGADILLRGELFGRLMINSRPGWAKLARRNGPLARTLTQ